MGLGARGIASLAVSGVLLAGLYVILKRPIVEADISSKAPPHADHTPRHGGVFFMAPDGFHHLEGTLKGREFRIYLYDNFTQPIDARRFEARVGHHRMEADPGGGYLRAQLEDPLATPPEVTAFVRFADDGREQRFDFTFLSPGIAQGR